RLLRAETLGRGVVGVARQDRACGRLRDEAIGVLLKKEALLDLLPRDALHPAVVAFLATVALLDRRPRIAGREALGPRDLERDVTRGEARFVALERPGCDLVPARVRAKRRLQQF